MKLTKDKIIACGGVLLVAFILAIVLFLQLQGTQEFSFFYREQMQLFLWDSEKIQGMFCAVGGGVKVLSQILVQFFVVPKMGALITALLVLVSAHFLWLGGKKLCKGTPCWWMAPLAFVPGILYCVYLLDNYAHYEGMVALCLMAFFFWLHTLTGKLNLYLRVGITSVLALALFFLGGSAGFLLALVCLLYEILSIGRKSALFLIPVALVIGAGIYSVNQGWVVSYTHAFWMKDYVEYYFELTTLYSLSWVSVLALLLLFWLMGKAALKNLWLQAGLALVLTAVLPICYSSLAEKHQDKGMYSLQRVIHYADTEQWDEIINRGHELTNNYITLNYLNLALSEKGQLLDKVFLFDQKGGQSLFMDYQQYTDIGVLRARQYYHMGVIAASQMNAVSSLMSITEGNPSMTQLSVKNYIITGRYNIADKYLRNLEKTWYYKDWAKKMRQFMNDKAVMADPELSQKRKDLPLNNDFFAIYAGMLSDTQTVFEANPEEQNAVNYATAYLLLEKKFEYIVPYVEYNYGKPWMKELPLRLQEAMVTAFEQDMDACRAHGVSEEVIAKFAQFRQDALTLRHSGGSTSRLAPKYGDTFWYYMLKK